MTEAEYIAVLWKIITAEGLVIVGLAGVVGRHLYTDGRVRERIRRLEDKLRLNGDPE